MITIEHLSKSYANTKVLDKIAILYTGKKVTGKGIYLGSDIKTNN